MTLRNCRRLLVTLVVSGLSMSVLTACGLGGTSAPQSVQQKKVGKDAPGVFKSGSTMAKIQQRGKLLVGGSFSSAPFLSENTVTGSPEGFDVDLVQQVARGIFGSSIEGKVTWIDLDPRERELALEQGKVDLVVGRYDVNAARKRFVDFAGPTYVTEQVVLVGNRDSAFPINNFLELNDKEVCTVRGSTNNDALLALLPAVRLSTVRNTASECGVDLQNGTVAAIAADAIDTTSYIDSAGTLVRVLKSDYGQTPYGVGVKKGVDDLRKYVNDRIELWEGWPASQNRYLGKVPGNPERPRVDRY